MKYTLEIHAPDDAPVRPAVRILAAVREQLPSEWKIKTTLKPDKAPRRPRARKTR